MDRVPQFGVTQVYQDEEAECEEELKDSVQMFMPGSAGSSDGIINFRAMSATDRNNDGELRRVSTINIMDLRGSRLHLKKAAPKFGPINKRSHSTLTKFFSPW